MMRRIRNLNAVALTPRYSNFTLIRALRLLPKHDRLKLYLITIAQVVGGLLDLIGVVLIGALGALSIQGIESRHAGNQVSKILNFLYIEKFSFQKQVAILGVLAFIIFTIKTIFSIIFTRKTFSFLSRKSAEISGDIVAKLLSKDLLFIQKRSTQEILFNISEGVKNLTSGILATYVSMIADTSMLIILSIGLFVLDPVIAIFTSVLFISVGLILFRLLQVRAQKIGVEVEKLIVKSNQKILEVLSAYREVVVHNRRQFYVHEIQKLRYSYGKVNSELMFQPYIGKYVLESIAVLGTFGIASFEFGTKSAVHAISVMVIFLASSTRIAPAVLRVQQGLLMIKSSSGTAATTLILIDELDSVNIDEEELGSVSFNYDGFEGKVVMSNVNFTYPNASGFALENINLVINSGSSVAIVGPSGAGKTTLIDLLLGILNPQSGSLKISDYPPVEVVKKWPGSISYVPQDVEVVEGSVKENIALGYPAEKVADELVWNAVSAAQLKEVIESMSDGLHTQVGENGSKISGGQRQRLGIARALFTSPQLLVLDEATSALDGQTEADISSAISLLSGKATVIIVAHRLSTVRNVDLVVYMDKGKILAKGSFDEVRAEIPDFDKQATLMGL